MQLSIETLASPAVEDMAVEIVERKGLGHPDTVCDALAEELSRSLSRFYMERFGQILHHNVDKVLLCAGEAEPAFGGGKITRPIEIFLAGRATTALKGVEVPLQALATECSHHWLQNNFHALDVEKHIQIHPLIRPGSHDLAELYLRGQREGVWLSNDTSCGVGYAPLSELETIVYSVERALNSQSVRESHPAFGEDVKVMGVRQADRIALTVACAFVGKFLKNLDDYAAAKADLVAMVRRTVGGLTTRDVSVQVNAGDDLDTGSIYLTVSGTSAEAGDDGEAGRGNRVNGLIAPGRPTTMESVAGKNPVTHVGKLYNLCASLASDRIVREVPEVTSAYCTLVSCIGRPVHEPQVVNIRVRTEGGGPKPAEIAAIEEIARDELRRIYSLSEDLLEGRLGINQWPLRTTDVGPSANEFPKESDN